MDIYWRICILLLGTTCMSNQLARGQGCGDSLSENEGYKRCTGNFSTLSDVFDAICSPEGRAAFQCILGIYKQCPELVGEGLESSDLDFNTVEMQGGIDVYCELINEGCLPILQSCTSKLQSRLRYDVIETAELSSEIRQSKPASETLFSKIPARIALACGSFREVMLCIFDTMEQCPRTASQMEEMVNDMVEEERRRLQPGSYFPTYTDVKSYIKDSCPSVPKDFKKKQECLMTSIGKTVFQECLKNITDHKTGDCSVYFGGKMCVEKYVEPDCGERYAQALVDASHLVSKDIPRHCALSLGVDIKEQTHAFALFMLATVTVLVFY